MKQLTEQEFKDRVEAIQRARKIFVMSGLTDNISTAFAIYQEIFAETERQLLITTEQKVPIGMRLSPLDDYERPKCPTCNEEMALRAIPENEQGFKTQWVCPTETCDVLNSENDINWWFDNLKRKES